jgi:hypothetical protein
MSVLRAAADVYDNPLEMFLANGRPKISNSSSELIRPSMRHIGTCQSFLLVLSHRRDRNTPHRQVLFTLPIRSLSSFPVAEGYCATEYATDIPPLVSLALGACSGEGSLEFRLGRGWCSK